MIAKTLHGRAHAKIEVKRWKVLKEFLFKKFFEASMDSSSDDEFGDEFFLKLEEEEEAIKQNGEKK